MKNSSSKYCLLLGTALMGLYLQANNAHAATADSTQPTNATQTTQQNNPAITVQTNEDNASTPQTTTDWANPADYKNCVPVQILGINDLHGGLDTTGKAAIGNKDYTNTGTAARLAGHLNAAESNFKSANPTGVTIRVEAGDMVGASPANSSLLQGESTLHALKDMGIEYGTVGNHEFDHGLPEYLKIVQGQTPDSFVTPAEKNYEHIPSGIQIVCANIVNKSDGQVPDGMKPYIIKKITAGNKTVKVGIIGIDTTTLPSLVQEKYLKNYKLLDEADTIAKYEKELREQKGVNAIIVLAHTGVATDKNSKTNGNSVDILQKLYQEDPDNSVDIYIAAHSHEYANATIGHTKLVQALFSGKAYDDIIGYIDPSTGDFANSSIVSHVYPVLSATDNPSVKDDPQVAAVVADANKRVKPFVNKTIGHAAEAKDILGRDHSTPSKENAVGELVLDGQIYTAKQKGYNPDFAIGNTGGIPGDLHVNADKSITWGSAFTIQPYGNILRVVTMTGQQIIDALNQQYAKNETDSLQVAGLHYIYTDDSTNHSYKVARVYDQNNQLLNPTKTYNVVISDFLARGGNNFTAFKDTTMKGIVGQDIDSLITYISGMQKAGTPITSPTLNRKVYMSSAELAKLDENQKNDSSQTNSTNPSTAVSDPKEENTSKTNIKNNESNSATSVQNGNITVVLPESNGSNTLITLENHKKAPATHERQLTNNKQAATGKHQLPQTGNDENTALLLLGASLLGATGLAYENRKRH